MATEKIPMGVYNTKNIKTKKRLTGFTWMFIKLRIKRLTGFTWVFIKLKI